MSQKTFTLNVHGIVKGQPRQRFRAFAVNGKMRGAGYTPSVAEEWKACIIRELDKLKPAKVTGPVTVCIVAAFARPKKHFTKKGLRPDAPVYCASKPDVDNLAKLIFDTLVTWGAIDDDANVVATSIVKRYANDYLPAGAEITVDYLPAGAEITVMQMYEVREGGMT